MQFNLTSNVPWPAGLVFVKPAFNDKFGSAFSWVALPSQEPFISWVQRDCSSVGPATGFIKQSACQLVLNDRSLATSASFGQIGPNHSIFQQMRMSSGTDRAFSPLPVYAFRTD